MGAYARLSQAEISIVPGVPSTVELTITNAGTVVDQFTVEPLGEAASWITTTPPAVSLLPQTQTTVAVTVLAPRRSDVPSGRIAFAVRVRSAEDAAGSVVEEGTLVVDPFLDAGGELLPRTVKARGRGRAKTELAVDNRGNEPVNATFTVVDPGDALEVEPSAPGLVVDPGQAAFLPFTVRARKGFWRGTDVTHQFQVVVAPGRGAPFTVDGTLLQQPRLPRWFGTLVAALVALAILLVVLWFTVLKPKIEDVAQDAATDQADKVAAAMANSPEEKAKQAKIDALASAAPSLLAAASSPPVVASPSATAGSGTTDPLGTPYFVRLAATAENQNPGVTFSAQQLASVTDLTLENPQGDTGTLTIVRGGDILFQTSLANFRDLDYHFVSPLVFNPGQVLGLRVTCEKPGAGAACTPSVSVGGFVRTPPSPLPTP